MSRRLVVGIDGSDESAVALRWAMDEARRRELDVELVHGFAIPVVSDAYGMMLCRPDLDDLNAYAEQLLDAAAQTARGMDDSIEVTRRVMSGPPAAVLLDASKEAAGLVVGARGIGAISGRMLGSVSIRVAAKGCCPVYVIPAGWDADRSLVDPVVVGVDGSPHGDAALALALDEALCRDVPLRLVTAYHVPWLARPIEPTLVQEFQTSERALAERTAHEALERARTERHRDVTIEEVFVECQPTEALITAGKEAVLTCVGSRGRSEIGRALLGSVSRAVLQEATRPVAVIHAPQQS